MLFLLKSRGPQTAAEAGVVLDISTPGAQQQLTRLAAAGLVAPDDRRQGRGRPRRYWALTEAGHGRFPDRHSDLTLDLLRATGELFGADGLERLVRHREKESLAVYRAALAGCRALPGRLTRLAEIRSREGYMAECAADGEGGWLFTENHCPICAAATLCQVFCRSELELFRAVLGPGVTVERTDHILAGARRCAYKIRVR